MKKTIKKGLGFGLASGVITTLGLLVGLYAGTHSKTIVLGAILLIAIADALSDALGIHVSEESSGAKNIEVWESTFSTAFFKFIFALTFIVPVLLFELQTAVIISVIWGFLLLGIFSFFIAKTRKVKPSKVITEHLVIAILVIIVTYLIGNWISTWA